MTTWAQWIGLFAAGGAGVCLRFVLSSRVDVALAARLPHVGTLLVNLLGCLVIGGLGAILTPGPLRTITLVGLLGGFTTYSSFALLSVDLAQSGRWGALALQLGAHLLGGVFLVVVGAAVVGLLGRTS